MGIIELSNVSFQYENSERGALHDVSLAVEPGECVLLCGESGCGKTTITRLLNGLIPHFYEGELQGRVSVCGLPVQEEELYTISEKVGSVFQNPRSQFFCLDTTSEVAFGCENMGLPEREIRERIEKVTSELHLEPLMGRNIFGLSGGEKQKIACASVAAMQPELMVLDEPTSNLDLDAIEELKKTLLLWKKQGKTIVIAEHRLYWLTEICDRVVYLKEGRKELDLSMQEFATFSEERLHELGLRGLSLQRLPTFLEQAGTEAVRTGITRAEAGAGATEIETTGRAAAGTGVTGIEDDGKEIIRAETIGLKNYFFGYENKEVLHIPELELPEKSVIALTGHNGAGKSTFSHCFCGLERRFRGKTIKRGEEKNARQMQKECYMVMQEVNHQLFCETVEDEIRLGMDEKRESEIPEVLRLLGLESLKDRHPMSLSGGQKQRVAIASAILADKSILVFDEPTSGLDYRHMKETAKLFRRLKEMGKTVLLITHDPELIALCCDQVLHLEHGEVEECYPLRRKEQERFRQQPAFY